jgi:STE24 endopeptidase
VVKAMAPEEAANAVAHEAGHLRDRSPGRLFFASLALVPLLWAVARLLRWLGKKGRLGFDGDRDVASLPMIFFMLWFLNMTTGPLSNTYTRVLERRADVFAFELLEEPEAFRSMMVKLARTNLADLHPPVLWSILMASHPPVMERIEAAEEFARRKGIAMSAPTPESFVIPDALDPLKQPARY